MRRRWSIRVELTHSSTAKESLLQSELLEKIHEALAALPEKQRTAILLLRESKISYESIAAILGTTILATKSLIYNGRNKLKRILRPYLRSDKVQPTRHRGDGGPFSEAFKTRTYGPRGPASGFRSRRQLL